MKSTTITLYKGFEIEENNENAQDFINNLVEEKKKTPGKLEALFILKNGYVEICPGIVIFNNNGVFTLTVCNLDGLIKGINKKMIADNPEQLREEIREEIEKIYNCSLSELLQEIENI